MLYIFVFLLGAATAWSIKGETWRSWSKSDKDEPFEGFDTALWATAIVTVVIYGLV
jgi:hypothetical protein